MQLSSSPTNEMKGDEEMGKYKQLTNNERSKIEGFLNESYTRSQIAKILGRSKSTINDEINRNSLEPGNYNADHAINKANERKMSQRRSFRKMKGAIVQEVEVLLQQDWSPEQISGWLKINELRSISHEAIYQHIWRDKAKGGSLHKHLRRQGRSYYKRGANGKTNRGRIKNRVGIEERPLIVDERSRIGDWEIDTIIGKSHQGAIISIIERKTRYSCLVKVKDKSAPSVTAGTYLKMRQFMAVLLTITSDNGKEFAWHQHLTNALGVDIYFARPCHSWERGTNENTNGLVRQYLPKKTDFTQITDEEVQCIEEKLNNRPRKCLGYKTPKEMMETALAA